ncbi:MAG: ferritin [Rhodothermales bacterium]|nr:ferritin [Rhodothermales bacterium]
MNARIQDAVNAQIQAEFASAYLYLALSARMEEQNLKGFAHWLRLQWQEETVHAMKLYDFLLQRGGRVALQTLEAPAAEAETPLAAFEQVLDHEQYVTRRINELYALALEENDYPLQTLLHWFIDEQIEEEEAAREIIDNLRLIGDAGSSLFLLDRELSQRQGGE